MLQRSMGGGSRGLGLLAAAQAKGSPYLSLEAKKLREINSIFVHCTATRPSQDIGVTKVRAWHKARGWSDIGYHYLIKRDGTVQKGRADKRAGAHTKGYNGTSLGVALVGGISEKGRPQFNYSGAQMKSLETLLQDLCFQYGIEIDQIHGHNEVSSKACPCFDVGQWLQGRYAAKLGAREKSETEGF